MKYSKSFLSLMLLFVLAVFLIPNFSAQAAPSEASLEKKVAGTYFITIEPDGGSQIVTLTSDGNWLSTNSQQFSFAFGDQQGAWQKTGMREITANVLDFNFNLSDGVQTGVTRSRWVVEFDSDFEALEGTVEVEIFAPDQNPLHPTEPPFFTLSSTFEGQRVTVDD
jgi:hypothetical protein